MIFIVWDYIVGGKVVYMMNGLWGECFFGLWEFFFIDELCGFEVIDFFVDENGILLDGFFV